MREPAEIRKTLAIHKGEILQLGGDGMAAVMGPLRIVASWGEGWDHVSVSLSKRVPRYEEMKKVKRVFFLPDETAVEYHVPTEKHVNQHNFTLHLWRPQNVELPTPPEWMV